MDKVIALRAIAYLKFLGWKGNKDNFTVKLVHPEGEDSFDKRGVVFVDGPVDQDGSFQRLCVLFPRQEMPPHHHKMRKETFRIIAGALRESLDPSHDMLLAGNYIQPDTEQVHRVQTDNRGAAYIGICNVLHNRDVYWENEGALVLPEQRVTTVKGEDVEEREFQEDWWDEKGNGQDFDQLFWVYKLCVEENNNPQEPDCYCHWKTNATIGMNVCSLHPETP